MKTYPASQGGWRGLSKKNKRVGKHWWINNARGERMWTSVSAEIGRREASAQGDKERREMNHFFIIFFSSVGFMLCVCGLQGSSPFLAPVEQGACLKFSFYVKSRQVLVETKSKQTKKLDCLSQIPTWYSLRTILALSDSVVCKCHRRQQSESPCLCVLGWQDMTGHGCVFSELVLVSTWTCMGFYRYMRTPDLKHNSENVTKSRKS